MSLYKRTILVVVSTFIALLFVLAVTSDFILVKSFSTLERTVLEDNVIKVRSEIEETYEELDASLKDISFDIIRKGARHVNSLEIHHFFNHRFDVVVCFSDSGKILSSRAVDFHNKRPVKLSDKDVRQIISILPLAAKSPGRALKGMLILDENPLQLVLVPVQGTTLKLLVGRYLDDEEVGRISSLIRFSIDTVPLIQEIEASNVIDILKEFEQGVLFPVRVLDNNRIAGYTLFKDVFDQPLLFCRVVEQRHLYQQGKAAIIYVIISLFIAGGVLCLVMLAFIRVTILKRFEFLRATAKEISDRRDISSRLPVSDEGDELSELTGSINAMLGSLESADSSLRESEERYRMLFDHAPDAITIIAIDGADNGSIVVANNFAAEQHGCTLEELCGMAISDIIATESSETMASIFKGVENGEWVTAELWKIKKDGSRFPVEIHAGPVKIRERSYILGFDRDITYRMLAEEADKVHLEHVAQLNSELTLKTEALAAANTELEAFNYSVSHDMRNPLTQIYGYCQVLLEDSTLLPPRHYSYITRINQAGLWLNDMIEAMLGLAQLTRQELLAERVNLSDIAENVMRGLLQPETQRMIEIVIEPDVTVTGDSRLLKIMMTNLLSNAWKYSSRQNLARIEFGVIRDEPETVYFVKDNGAGFDMTDYDKLFRVFKRLHGSAEFGGTGVGLATVQRIINRHGGKIWATGEVGNGATFFFTLHSS